MSDKRAERKARIQKLVGPFKVSEGQIEENEGAITPELREAYAPRAAEAAGVDLEEWRKNQSFEGDQPFDYKQPMGYSSHTSKKKQFPMQQMQMPKKGQR